MSSTSVTAHAVPPVRFFASTIGRKIVMAVTGLALVGFAIAHLTGNLLVFLGPGPIHDYAVWLREIGHGVVIWILRAGVLAAATLHVWSATSLTLESRAARPVGYREAEVRGSTLASRTMRWSGYLLLAYIFYHLLDMTFGTAHPDFVHLDPYRNLVVGFQRKTVAFGYIGAMVLLYFHLAHGVWSMLRTLGLSHPRYMRLAQLGSRAFAAVLVLGYISIPVAVLLGILK